VWKVAREAPPDLEDAFPGRWDPRRALDAPLRPLVAALAEAIAEAGWQSLASVGLILGVDRHVEPAARRFGEALQAEQRLSPATFLCSLPSTAATTLSVLFQVQGYQATLGSGPESGALALSHAADLLALGRLERVIVGALSPEGEATLAVVALLEAGAEDEGPLPTHAKPPQGSAAARLVEVLTGFT
jgi:3-oxoacyl-(acyl-carrier-protein) synthase